MADKHQETQEQSIKARKHQLFDADAPAGPVGSGRPFEEFLRDTPAAPLSGGMKAALWATGAVVAVLLIAALIKSTRHKATAPAPATKSAARLAPGPHPARATTRRISRTTPLTASFRVVLIQQYKRGGIASASRVPSLSARYERSVR